MYRVVMFIENCWKRFSNSDVFRKNSKKLLATYSPFNSSLSAGLDIATNTVAFAT